MSIAQSWPIERARQILCGRRLKPTRSPAHVPQHRRRRCWQPPSVRGKRPQSKTYVNTTGRSRFSHWLYPIGEHVRSVGACSMRDRNIADSMHALVQNYNIAQVSLSMHLSEIAILACSAIALLGIIENDSRYVWTSDAFMRLICLSTLRQCSSPVRPGCLHARRRHPRPRQQGLELLARM